MENKYRLESAYGDALPLTLLEQRHGKTWVKALDRLKADASGLVTTLHQHGQTLKVFRAPNENVTMPKPLAKEYRFFNATEFACPCCGKNDINDSLVMRLDLARGTAEVPFIITSGYRCKSHNRHVGGSEHSSHLTGHAVDIRINNINQRFHILQGLMFAGFNRIGVGGTLIHADIDPDKLQNCLWTYTGK